MARTPAELINRELVSFREWMGNEVVRNTVLARGIAAVPSLHRDGRPVDTLSLRVASRASIEGATRLPASAQ